MHCNVCKHCAMVTMSWNHTQSFSLKHVHTNSSFGKITIQINKDVCAFKNSILFDVDACDAVVAGVVYDNNPGVPLARHLLGGDFKLVLQMRQKYEGRRGWLDKMVEATDKTQVNRLVTCFMNTVGKQAEEKR